MRCLAASIDTLVCSSRICIERRQLSDRLQIEGRSLFDSNDDETASWFDASPDPVNLDENGVARRGSTVDMQDKRQANDGGPACSVSSDDVQAVKVKLERIILDNGALFSRTHENLFENIDEINRVISKLDNDMACLRQ
jgi:hypothetical protein